LWGEYEKENSKENKKVLTKSKKAIKNIKIFEF